MFFFVWDQACLILSKRFSILLFCFCMLPMASYHSPKQMANIMSRLLGLLPVGFTIYPSGHCRTRQVSGDMLSFLLNLSQARQGGSPGPQVGVELQETVPAWCVSRAVDRRHSGSLRGGP